jgi:hypothetical protein
MKRAWEEMMEFMVEAVMHIFQPAKDNYPASGVQPFTGEPSR